MYQRSQDDHNETESSPNLAGGILGASAELERQVERFNTLRDAHFGYDPQALNAGHIGQIKRGILQVAGTQLRCLRTSNHTATEGAPCSTRMTILTTA